MWHRLTSCPDLTSATFLLEHESSGQEPKSDQLNEITTKCFNFLCTTNGFLTFQVDGLRGSDREDEKSPDTRRHALTFGMMTWLKVVSVGKLMGNYALSSPDDAFRQHASGSDQSQAQCVSQDLPEQPEAVFDPYSQLVHDFAYKGVVGVEAWAGKQHEAANDWYAHIGDFHDIDV